MKTIFEHFEYLKGKPHHIRKKIAFGVAAAGSALIGLIWLVSSVAAGTFAIQGTSFAESMGQGNVVATTSASGNQGLAGVAASAALQDTSAPAHIEIVDTTAAPSSKKQSEQTILPF